MEIYSNGIGKVDNEFVVKTLSFFEDNPNKYFTVMDAKKKIGLTRTAIILSINELVSKNKLEKIFENQKNKFKLKEEI